MYDLLLIVFLLIAICLIVLILIQQGKGATMGASFGSGASGTLFGSTGAGNFMTRSTGVLAALFFILSLVLGNFASRSTQSSSDEWSNLGKQPVVTQQQAPATSQTIVEPVQDPATKAATTLESSAKVADPKPISQTAATQTNQSSTVADKAVKSEAASKVVSPKQNKNSK